jgi:hypothetical protein
MKKAFLTATLAFLPMVASAGVFGPLANFDVVNDTGSTAHGFEIELHGIHKTDITSIFGDVTRWTGMERYDSPTVVEGTDNQGQPVVTVTYQSTLVGGKWKAGTPSGAVPTPHDSCWPLGTPGFVPVGGTIYDSTYPCDHFGISANKNPTNTIYRWLTETSPGSTSLAKTDVVVPSPVFTVTPNPLPPVLVQPPAPPVPPGQPPAPLPPKVLQPLPPIVNVVVAAPQPNFYEFGEARWVKVTASGTLHNVAVEDLVADNAALKNAKQQTQTEWQLLQVDSGAPGSGQIDLTGVALDQGASGVVYRFEFYKYTGRYDPASHEAFSINGDTATPAASDLGKLLVAQNVGVNFDGVIPPAPPLPIAPAINQSIAGGVIGQVYNQPIAGKAANAGDVLAYAVTGLPAGLSFEAIANAIVGTPQAVGTFAIKIVVTDVTNGLSTTADTNLVVAYAPVVFNVSFPHATQYADYSYLFSATGNGAISYSILEALPNGLSLNAATLSGKPQVSGNFPLTITAKDIQGFSQNVSATLAVDPAAPPVVPPVVPPAPAACSGANQIISFVNPQPGAPRLPFVEVGGGAQNGGKSITIAAPPAVKYTFNGVPYGQFPIGSLITYTGVLDQANFFCVTDTVTVAQGLTFPAISLPKGQAGIAYTDIPVKPTGGVAPYTIVVQNLPAGLNFTNGFIGGTPLSAGSYTVSISINDNNGQSNFQTLPLVIDAAPVVNVSATLPAGQAGIAYPATTIASSGGIGAITLTQTGLPTGLSLAGNAIAGTPAVAGTFQVTITAKDSFGTIGTVTNTVVVNPAPAVTISATLPSGQATVAYPSTTIALGGGIGAITLSQTGLPTGLSLTGNVISGTPTVSGTLSVVFTAKDSFGTTASSTVSLTIAAAPVVVPPPVVNPPVSCTKPKGAVSSAAKSSIMSVNGATLTTASGVKLSVLPCATVEWNRSSHVYKVGDRIEWQGWIDGAVVDATIVTLN